jgi:hypothetical protein
MAIGTNDLIDVFGTQDTITTGTPAQIANAAFSVAGDVGTWTNDDDAPLAAFQLKCQWATATGVANKRVNLYARLLNIDSTNDAVAPSTSRKWQPIGAFTVYALATGTDYYFDSGIVRLPNAKTSQEYEFYLENLTGQTISNNWELKVTPMSQGPHP